MKKISVKDKLPLLGRYVVCHYTGGNWTDFADQEGCEWVVARRVNDTGGNNPNNKRKYYWDTFGPGMIFGQEVDYWAELPRRR